MTLVLASLLFSLLLYLALVVSSAWLCYWLVTAPWPRGRGADRLFLVRIVPIIASGLLFLYLLKGLFKSSRRDQALLVEIKEVDQPELFDFIRQVCAETRAPFPHKVYLTPEVNAAVFYESSFLSLVLPTPKNLLIGLGLVNMLNLSEFKAVLAHEFGHFSQNSMKVGSYVYVANKVLGDIIYGRDFLDDMVHQVKSWDLRIAIFVWIFLGVLWGLRKILEAIFKVINIFNLSLMRQMEFNADRVAVSVAGSDPMVHALLRSSFADQAFRQLMSDLWAAADHQLYTRDMFRHQLPASDMLRRRAKKPDWGKRPENPGPAVHVFQPGEGMEGIPPMWSTHPSNHDREQSAKATYLSVDVDERSPWLLFRDEGDIRFRVTQRYYEIAHKPERTPTFTDAQAVQTFLDEEYAETTYPERYHGFYDNRYLEIADLPLLIRRAQTTATTPEQAADELDKLYGADLKIWVEKNQKRLGEFDLLAGLQGGQLTLNSKTLDFRGQAYAPVDVPMLLREVQQELEEDQRYKAVLDERVFVAHGQLAQGVGEPSATDLFDRYRFHLALQDLHRQNVQGLNDIQGALNYAGSRRELSQEEFAGIRELLGQAAGKLVDVLDGAKKLRVPALKNMQAGQYLRPFLLQKPVLSNLAPAQNTIDATWVNQCLAQLGEVEDKLKRLLFKSMGGILSAQDRIVEQSRLPQGNAAEHQESALEARR